MKKLKPLAVYLKDMNKIIIWCIFFNYHHLDCNTSIWDKIKLTAAITKLTAVSLNIVVVTGKAVEAATTDESLELKKQYRLLKAQEKFTDCLVRNIKSEIINEIPAACSECKQDLILAGGSEKATNLIQEFKAVAKTVTEKKIVEDGLSSSEKALIISGCVLAVAATGVAIVMIPGAAPAIIAAAKSAADIARDATTQYVNDFKNLPTTDKIIHVAKIADKVDTSSIKPLKETEFISNGGCELIQLRRQARENGSLTERVQKKYS